MNNNMKEKWANRTAYAILALLLCFGFAFTAQTTVALHTVLTGEVILAMLLSCVLCLPWCQWLRDRKGTAALETASYPGAFVLYLLCLMRLAAGGFAPFIYFQF